MRIHVNLKPQPGVRTEKIRIKKRSCILVLPEKDGENGPAVLWIHGGGYILGMKEMVHMSRAADLVRKYHAAVLSPGYRLALFSPYPAAAEDCYEALCWLKEHAAEFGARSDQIMVGGESAGGGLAAAVCMMAKDRGDVRIAFQMPLYPMLDDRDTDSSRENHGRIWNTRRNHFGWRMYLRRTKKKGIPAYAAPARREDFSGLPPCYTFVGDGEPFYDETLQYVEKLKAAGIKASCDVWHTDIHAFDMLCPQLEESRKAAGKFDEMFRHACRTYFAAQKQGGEEK